MKLRDCKHGTIVTSRTCDGIGMIVGITNNVSTAEQSVRREPWRAIPLVQWASGEICGIHQANIEIYKGDY